MNYRKHYMLLIDRAKCRVIDAHTEKHHIVPRCMGGKDDPNNLVRLTPEEHYVAHQLLVKLHPTNSKLLYAANMMTIGGCRRRNNKLYGWIKRKISASVETRDRAISNFSKNRPECSPTKGLAWFNDGVNSKMFDPSKILPDGWIRGRLFEYKSEATKKKSYSNVTKYAGHNKGKPTPKIVKEKISNALRGRKISRDVSGENNPAWGSTYVWVNDGIRNIRWKNSLEEIPSHYKVGMIK